MKPYRAKDNYLKGRDQLGQDLHLACEMFDVDTDIIHVKEKYGRLDISVMGYAPDEFLIICNKIEDRSETICDQCGRPGKLRGDLPWMRTLCFYHYLIKLSIILYRRIKLLFKY